MLDQIPRRALLTALGAAASPFVLPRTLARAAFADTPFTLGVASGEPWPDGFLIWTRLAPEPLAPDGSGGMTAPVAVRWEVFADESLKVVAASGQVDADARWAHSVHVEVAGLRANRPYWYRFTALGAQSPVGRARTAPATGQALSSLKLTVASCAHYEVGWFSPYRHMAAEQPDLSVFLGDYIYEYSYRPTRTDLVRRHDRQEECFTLAHYRNRYAQAKTDPDLQALHHAAPWLITWDDHELQNDYADKWSAYAGATEAQHWARRVAAYQAFYEHMPLRARSVPREGALRLYDRYRFGDLAEFNFVDGRQYRSKHACPGPNDSRGHVAPLSCPDWTDPTRSFLGREQEAWLYDGFRRSGARWNILAQPCQFTPYLQKGPGGILGEYTESWSAHGLSRQRLTDAMVGARLKNPVVFGGDSHCFVAADVKADFKRPDSAVIASEFVGTSVTSDKMADAFGETLGLNPHVKFFEPAYRGYYSVELTPRRMTTRFQAVSNRLDPKATVRTLKAFTIENGRPGLVVS